MSRLFEGIIQLGICMLGPLVLAFHTCFSINTVHTMNFTCTLLTVAACDLCAVPSTTIGTVSTSILSIVQDDFSNVEMDQT
jgi:hypothetical protein